MTTRDKIVNHVGSLPPFACTHAELAARLGVSAPGVTIAIHELMAAGTLRIEGKVGGKTVYQVVKRSEGGGQ